MRRTLVSAFSLALVLAALTAPAHAGDDPLETLQPGPYAVGFIDWDFGSVELSGVNGPGTINRDHFGRVFYPATVAGEGTPAANGFPFPLIVWAHGRFHQTPFINHNHEQAAYLTEHLASWGFFVASVNLDVVGAFSFPAAIPQRAELIHHTLSAFFAFDPNEVLIDRTRIGVAGHSRGGDGAIQAWLTNPDGHPIHAVATISPTDFDDTSLGAVPYLGLYGSKDGDVNNGWPIKQYDKASGATKAFEYIHGANHFWFTDTIHFSGEGNGDITRAQHHEIARSTMAHFFRSAFGLNNDPDFTELADGPGLAPLTDVIEILPNYSNPTHYVINNVEAFPINPSLNSQGLLSAGSLLTLLDEQGLNNAGQTFYHRTKAVRAEFNAPGPSAPFYLEEVSPFVDPSQWDFLSFRALQKVNGPLNTPGVEQEFTVAVVDAAGEVATVPLTDHGKVVWPATHTGSSFPQKSVLRTTRIPLRAFKTANNLLQLSQIRYIAVVFNQNDAGDLRLDDFVFTD